MLVSKTKSCLSLETDKSEFSLNFFKLLMNSEIQRRGIKGPELIERYPSLVNRRPEKLPGIEELEGLVKDCAVVISDDLCHHGIAYGVPENLAIEIGDTAYNFAKTAIDTGFQYLKKGDYARYYDHWMHPEAIGDPTDCAIVQRFLLGNATYNVLDLKIVDVSRLFEANPTPSWVAAALVEITRA